MTLIDDLLSEIKVCMKEGKKEQLTCLRGVHSDIKNVRINKKVDITDQLVIEVLAKGIKQRKDASEQFSQGGRHDLVDKNNQEIKWLEKYMPEQLGQDELTKMVEEAIAQSGAQSKKEMGKVMGVLIPKTKGRADGKLLSQLVSSKLS